MYYQYYQSVLSICSLERRLVMYLFGSWVECYLNDMGWHAHPPFSVAVGDAPS